jgi:putative ABC transport system ATP-binding protein/lipoprotein-releasing system ATP-binding protein
MIEVKELIKSYSIDGQIFKAVDGVSFTISKGDMVSIVGHSGSGKTTLLSLLGGLTKPDSGSIVIGSENILSMTDNILSEFRNRKISFIYQFSSLIPTLTVLENVILPTVFRSQRQNVASHALELLSIVGLQNKINAYPSQLSGGQQRRVAIARAFVNDPELILADEPTGDLDEETEAEMMQFFSSMNRDKGLTFLVVTHNTELAKKIGRQLRMQNGVLQEVIGNS